MRTNRRTRTTVAIRCESWRKLGRLLDEYRGGRTQICVRRLGGFEPGEEVSVALRLPDELVLAIDALVDSTRRDPRSGESIVYLDLVGLDEVLASRLEDLCLSRVA